MAAPHRHTNQVEQFTGVESRFALTTAQASGTDGFCEVADIAAGDSHR